LSDFFQTINQIESLQGNILVSLEGIRELKSNLEIKQEDLGIQNEENTRLKVLEVAQQRSLEVNKQRKQVVLNQKQSEITKKKRDLATLKTQLFYLEKTGISVEDAVRYAELAASRAGIRTAFLLAILEIETGKQFEAGVISVGTNLGTGNWYRDMYQCYINLGKPKTAERQKAAFFEITEELGFIADEMPVSRKPSYGCGGAMGPAQFIPTTWVLYKDRVAQLTGHSPANPWNVEDAFTASAIYLADAGATKQTYASEEAAARAYIGGPGCTRRVCRIYAKNVTTLAAVIDRSL
jgi:membrane-bound lytic murein transglycosylase B